jgi:hypothetical protein
MWRLLRLMLRSFWISALFAISGWLVSQALGWPLPLLAWAGAAYALFMILLPTMILWPLPPQRVARRLDHAFGLRDRLATAGEVARRRPANYLENELLRSATALLADVRRRLELRPRIPWLDLELSLLAILIILAVAIGAITAPVPPTVADADSPPLPALSPEPQLNLPGLAPAGGPGSQAPFGSPEGAAGPDGLGASEAQEAYDALTQALGENPITQRAASSLAQGNASQAAEDLRDLAAQADSLSPDARQQLAGSLRRAADQLEQSAPDVAEQLREAAEGLADTGPESGDRAASALEDLARLVEALDDARGAPAGDMAGSEQPGDAGQGGGAGQGSAGREQQSAGTVERLQGEGQAFELPEGDLEGDGVLQPPEHPGSATEQRETPYSQGTVRGTGGDQPADRLSLPWRLRNVIQRYFSPP